MLFWEVERGWSASWSAGSWLAGHGCVWLSFHAQAERGAIRRRRWLVGGDGMPRSRERERRPCSAWSRVQVIGPGRSALVGAVIAGIGPGRMSSGCLVVSQVRGPAVRRGVQGGGGQRRWSWIGLGLDVAGRPKSVDHPGLQRVERLSRGPSRGSACVADRRSGVSTQPVVEAAKVARYSPQRAGHRQCRSPPAVRRSPVGVRSAVAG